MLLQIEVSAVDNARQFCPAYREQVFYVVTIAGVMGKLILVMLAEPEVLLFDAQVDIPVEPFLYPLIEPLPISARLDEVLDFHLLELAHPEDEVARGNLISEGFAYLGNTEGQLPSSRCNHVREIDEYALSGLRAQIDNGCLILHGAYEGFKHEIEHAWFGKLPAAGRALPILNMAGAPR